MLKDKLGWELAFTLLDKLVNFALKSLAPCWELAFTLLDKLASYPGSIWTPLGISIHPS